MATLVAVSAYPTRCKPSGTSLFSLKASEVEAVELYKPGLPGNADLSRTLAARLRAAGPSACGIHPARRPAAENAWLVVIWMKK